MSTGYFSLSLVSLETNKLNLYLSYIFHYTYIIYMHMIVGFIEKWTTHHWKCYKMLYYKIVNNAYKQDLTLHRMK